jgi:dTDP-4-dehydrorhamnose reductase
MESQVQYCIIRTSWLFSEHGNNFLKTILRLSKERDKLTIVSDQFGQPTYAGDLSDAIITILPAIVKKNFSSQIFHFSGNPACSWYDFAKEIIEQAILTGILEKEIEVIPITTKEYPTPAPRPMYSVLDCSAIKKFYNIELSDWKSAVSNVLKKIQENKQQ